VFLGDGAGGLLPEIESSGFTATRRASFVDVTQDGLVDLIAPALVATTSVLVVPGAATGQFADAIPLQGVTANWTYAFAGPLDADPWPEVVATLASTAIIDFGTIIIWPGTGQGQWGSLPSERRTSSGLLGGTLTDFDGDGLLDLVSATDDDSVIVLVGDGSGGFACEQTYPGGESFAPEHLAVGDVDGNGLVDIVFADPVALTVTVVRRL
jgi:hypothetical protein